ncbi:MAG: HDIG domain-containing protein [Akkermansiaceae bacterium]|nr:HDIG domain-containing protein [Akkermansiaceae bacterium]
MGFLDALKRWRLAQQGLSTGKKRRIHTESLMAQALDNSVWLRVSLFLTFTVSCAVMALNAGPESTFTANPSTGALYAIVLCVTAIVMSHLTMRDRCHRNSRILLVYGVILVHLLLIKSLVALSYSAVLPGNYLIFVLPYCLSPMLHGILLGRAVGCFSTIFCTFMGMLLVPSGEVLSYLLLSLSAGMLSVMVAHNVRKRVQLLQTGIYVGALIVLICVVIGRLDITSAFGENAVVNLQELGTGAVSAFGIALLTALLISGFLPIFEGTFHLTTDISWLELSDLNHKLLRRMQLEAPGTFHHSLIVASLAEAAAESIGANAPMCRVCAYFHDVGKLKKPGYFIENQHEGAENPHDQLTPTMSSLIIIAHVKDGIDFAVKHKLNPRIIDVIQEHHGDSLVAYFYRRAQEQKLAEMEKVDKKLENPEDLPKVDEKNFRYPGPRPSTRESAIISLADTIESASRSLRKPTPARIRAMVDELVRAKLEDGQLDNCPLTLKDLSKIRKSFASTLRSMMHTRIDYPKDDDGGPASKRPTSRGSDLSDDNRVIEMPKKDAETSSKKTRSSRKSHLRSQRA